MENKSKNLQIGFILHFVFKKCIFALLNQLHTHSSKELAAFPNHKSEKNRSMSLSKNQIKLIRSLNQKKSRHKHGLFVVEGTKTVQEFLSSSFELDSLFVTDALHSTFDAFNFQEVLPSEIKKISALTNPSGVLALFQIPKKEMLDARGLVLALDGVNDPGNLGTIIRLCDWFGISQLVCSKNTVDCFNPKVVQATMGSLTRVQIHYVDLERYLQTSTAPKYMADMNGEDVYKSNLPEEAILIMGNEANGVCQEIQKQCTHRLSIPRFGTLQKTESLNVASATAILLSEFKRS